MDLYTLKVDKFRITDTRALVDDTLHLAYSAYVNGDLVAQNGPLHLSEEHGDFNNGEYVPDDYVPDEKKGGLKRVVINDPTSQVAFIYQLVNAGNVPPDALTGRMAASADQLAGMTAGLAGAAGLAAAIGSPYIWAAVVLEAFATVYSWLTVSCDGPVAVDQVSGPRYMLDAWTDTPDKSLKYEREYPGLDSPTGCGGNSKYNVWWSLHHQRAWVEVGSLAAGLLRTDSSASAAAHNGAVYAFGATELGIFGHRTFTGANWEHLRVNVIDVDYLANPLNSNLPVSAISFNDRLYIFGVHIDGSIKTLVYTVDGSSWTKFISGPNGLRTTRPIATVEFHNRLYLLARDRTSNRLRLTSTDDVEAWDSWNDVPEPPGSPPEAVAAASLGGVLHIFGVYPHTQNVSGLLHSLTADGITWTAWLGVEGGAHPKGAANVPIDVAAGIFQNRIYLASRWMPLDPQADVLLALNFSADSENWSGWRVPQSDNKKIVGYDFEAGATATLASVNNHLYLFAPMIGGDSVWAY